MQHPVTKIPETFKDVQQIMKQELGDKGSRKEQMNATGQMESTPRSLPRMERDDAIVSAVNGKYCPWIDFDGPPGSKGYANQSAVWLSDRFAPERYEVREDAGWWYAEIAPSVLEPHDKH